MTVSLSVTPVYRILKSVSVVIVLAGLFFLVTSVFGATL